MSWVKYKIEPLSPEDKNFLNTYNEVVLETSEQINNYRMERFEEQEQIFEIDLDLVGTERSELYTPDLPYTHIRQLVDLNADLWKDEIYRCIEEQRETVNKQRVSAERTASLLPYGLLYWSDYSISNGRVSIKTNDGSIYKYKIKTEDSIIGSVPNHSISKLYPDERTIAIKTSNDHSTRNKSMEISGNVATGNLSDVECLIRILTVYNTDQPATQVDIPTESEIDYIELFNMLGMYWKNPLKNTYLITNSLDYLEKIESFLNKAEKDRNLIEYYTLFGYPENCGERLESTKGCYDDLSGEEFVLYGIQNGLISHKLAENIRYVPYQPKPTIESVHTALVRVRDRFNDITEASTTLNNMKGHTTKELINLYKSERKDYQWKTLDVSTYLTNQE